MSEGFVEIPPLPDQTDGQKPMHLRDRLAIGEHHASYSFQLHIPPGTDQQHRQCVSGVWISMTNVKCPLRMGDGFLDPSTLTVLHGEIDFSLYLMRIDRERSFKILDALLQFARVLSL